MSHKRRIKALECYAAKNAAADTPAWLVELEQTVNGFSKAQTVEFLESWIEQAAGEFQTFLIDWRDFLHLQGTPTWPDFERGTMRYIETPASRRWAEIHARRWQWAGWTGFGLPPELRERHVT